MAPAQRTGVCLLCDGGGCGRSRRGTGDHHCCVPHARDSECRQGEFAEAMTQNPLLCTIPLLPLAGAAINGFFGRRSSKQAITTVALVFCGAAFAVALWIASQFSSASAPYYFPLAHWIRSGTFTADF